MSERMKKICYRLNPTIACSCGCGREFKQFDSRYRKRTYIPNHQRIGKTNSEYQKKRVRECMLGPNNHRWISDRNRVGRHGQDFLKSQIKKLRKEFCEWCGCKDNLHLDHIIPVFAGGTNSELNAQTLCRKCNNLKRDIDYKTYGKQMRSNSVNEEILIPSQALVSEGVETKRPPSEKSEDIVQVF